MNCETFFSLIFRPQTFTKRKTFLHVHRHQSLLFCVLRYTLDFVPSVFFLSIKVCCRVLEIVVVEMFACLFPEIMTRLIKIIHRACCEKLHFYQNHLDG